MRKTIHAHIITVFLLFTINVSTSFGATVTPGHMVVDMKMNTGYYTTADEACEAAMPNANFTSSGALFHPDYGPGCLYRASYIPNQEIFGQNFIKAVLVCPLDYAYTSGVCKSDKPDNDDTCEVGNPVRIATGIKNQVEVDFSLPGNTLLPLQIKRYYTSYVVNPTNHYGHGWSLKPYYLQINAVPSENKVIAYRAPNRTWTFYLDSGMTYISTDAPDAILEYVTDSEGDYWRLTGKSFDQEIYGSTTGSLLRLEKGRHYQVLTYSNASTPTTIASSEDLLIKITDEKGRSLDLFYDSENLLSHVDFDNQTVLTYKYGSEVWNDNRQLNSVTFADARARQYHYKPYARPTGAFSSTLLRDNNLYVVSGTHSEAAINSTNMNALSLSLGGYSVAPLIGITDENGNLYASWGYDDQGRAIFSEHANGAERVDLSFNADNSTTITNALGKQTTYRYQAINNTRKLTEIEGIPSANCSGTSKSFAYDINGFLVSRTDNNGNVTTYTRDAQGRELSRTEASGTPQARTITTTWDVNLNKRLTVTEPEQITEYTYDTEGRLQSQRQRSRE
ncbi:MAG: DUF6531 domain-containing protein [Candidatus Thiodiazotropha sp. LLP2]